MNNLEQKVKQRIKNCLTNIALAIKEGNIEGMREHNNYFKRQNQIMYKYLKPGTDMIYHYYQRSIDKAIERLK